MGMHAKRTLADIVQRITILNESVNESNMLITRSEKIIEDRTRMLERIDNDRKRGKTRTYHADEHFHERDIVVREREIVSHKLALKTYDNRRRALLKELATYENMSGVVYREFYGLGKTGATA
jgi:nuclear transport factor 2 (NTF2) superfamily protein